MKYVVLNKFINSLKKIHSLIFITLRFFLDNIPILIKKLQKFIKQSFRVLINIAAHTGIVLIKYSFLITTKMPLLKLIIKGIIDILKFQAPSIIIPHIFFIKIFLPKLTLHLSYSIHFQIIKPIFRLKIISQVK